MIDRMKDYTKQGYKILYVLLISIVFIAVYSSIIIFKICNDQSGILNFIIVESIVIAILLIFIISPILKSNGSLRRCQNKMTKLEIGAVNCYECRRLKLKRLFLTKEIIGYRKGCSTNWILVKDIVSMYHTANHIFFVTKNKRKYRFAWPVPNQYRDEFFSIMALYILTKNEGVLIGDQYSEWKIQDLIHTVEETDELIDEDRRYANECVGGLKLEKQLEGFDYTDYTQGKFSKFLFVLMILVCYLLVFVLYLFKPTDLFTINNYLYRDLYGIIWNTYGTGFLISAPIVISICAWFWRMNSSNEKEHINIVCFYTSIIILSIMVLVGFMRISEDMFGSGKAILDLRAYKAGKLERYEGPIFLTDRPEFEGTYIVTEDQYQYVSGDDKKVNKVEDYNGSDMYFAFYPEGFVNHALMQNSYKVVYTPNLRIAVSIKDSEQYERIALNQKDLAEEQKVYDQFYESQGEKLKADSIDFWNIGDVHIKKNPDILGYNELSEDEQIDFDYLYNESKFDTDAIIFHFALPRPISGKSFNRILNIYEGNCQYDSLQRKGYNTSNEGTVYDAYASTRQFPIESYNSFSDQYQIEAERIAGEIPENMSLQEKLEVICAYLCQNVEAFDYSAWLEATDNGTNTSLPGYENGELSKTGYGALCNHTARERGFMEAFGMIAKKAGIYTVPVIDEDQSEYWNMILIDGNWYGINSYRLSCEPQNKSSYYLVQNPDLEDKLQYYCDTAED